MLEAKCRICLNTRAELSPLRGFNPGSLHRRVAGAFRRNVHVRAAADAPVRHPCLRGTPTLLVLMITTPCCTHSAQPGLFYTLAPLLKLGAAALAPDPALGIKGVSLRELGIGWENVFQEVVVRRASDVLACAAATGSWYDPLPPGARLVCAIRVKLSRRERFRFSCQCCPPRRNIVPKMFAGFWPLGRVIFYMTPS